MELLDHLYQPSKTENSTQLIILLHGYGSNKEDLYSFSPYIHDKSHVVSLEAPMALPFGGNAWYSINFDAEKGKWSDVDEAKKNSVLLLDNIAHWKEKTGAEKVLLMGFSQGAIMSYATAFGNPDLVQSVVAMSGYLMEGWQNPVPMPTSFSIFASHGLADNVIPIEWAKDSVVAIDQQNVDITFHEYPEGHGVSQANFQDLMHWLKGKDWA
ncbi:MAG: alpha/beta fold hydrolase [Schleiferiaceae bacterium]